MNRISLFVISALVVVLLGASQLALATPPPTQLTVVRGPGQSAYVQLNWQPVAGGVSYNVYRSTTFPVTISSPINPTPIAGTTYQDPLGPTPPCFYVVTAYDGTTWSGPSNTVGYTAVNGLHGTAPGNPYYTPFGIAFVTWASNGMTYGSSSLTREDVFDSQLTCGPIATSDRLMETCGGGAFAYHTCSPNVWAGPLTTLTLGSPDYYSIPSAHTNNTILVCGEADPSGNYGNRTINMPSGAGQHAVTCYAWRDPRELQTNQLNLVQHGSFQGGAIPSLSDHIISLGPVDAGKIAWCDNSGNFHGNLTHVVPGQAYLIEMVHQGASWSYNFDASLVP